MHADTKLGKLKVTFLIFWYSPSKIGVVFKVMGSLKSAASQERVPGQEVAWFVKVMSL